MTNILGALLALVIVADLRGPQVALSSSMGGGQPATKPNFSGEWKINVAKSNFGPLPPPTVMNRTITHTEPALTIVEEQQSAMGDQKTTRKYVTDGSEITFDVQGTVGGELRRVEGAPRCSFVARGRDRHHVRRPDDAVG